MITTFVSIGMLSINNSTTIEKYRDEEASNEDEYGNESTDLKIILIKDRVSLWAYIP